MLPKFSIITVCFNSESTIVDTIESILYQTYKCYEYIIIDGKSTDNTVEILRSYEEKFIDKEIRYKWISEPDNGIYDAMNKGLQIASGDLIGILNSDDWYEKDALDSIKNIYNVNFNLAIYAGEMNRVNEDKKVYKINYNKRPVKKFIKKVMPLNHPATFVHKYVYQKVGYFNTSYQLSSDYDFVFRAYNFNTKFLFTEKIIVNMRNSGVTGSLESLWVTAKEDNDIRIKNKVKWSKFYYFKRLIFNYLIIARDKLKGK